MRKKLLHYGLQRSGTNFLESLLAKNFDIKIHSLRKERDHPLQKHFRLYDDKTKIPEAKYLNNYNFKSYIDFKKSWGLNTEINGVIVISKDPYSWLLSYEKWSKKCNWPNPSYQYIEEYNLFLNKWRVFAQQSNEILFIRYIDLLVQPEIELTKIENKFSLKRRWNIRRNGLKIALDKVKVSEKFSKEKKEFYTKKKYLNNYNKTKLENTNYFLDEKLMSFLNYKLE
ncbi:MAG: hypothetical protein P8M12_00395 [Flavobacteriales bacterium]|nr:hypothetical protein [Flavobacteriales bacterium]